MTNKIFNFLAIICFVYFLIIALYTGLVSKFHLIWLFFSIIFAVLGKVCIWQQNGMIHIPKSILIISYAVCIFMIVIFVSTEAVIIKHGSSTPKADADYMVVLGAQVKGKNPSLPLKYRLEAAQGYLSDNPDTVVVVSGGQGSGEDISEAEAMRRYLVKHDIDDSRIIKEEESENTDENIRYSREIIGDDNASVIIVTNAFHIYRSVGICKKQGMTDVEGLGAKSNLLAVPSFYLREAIAVLKYKLAGQI